MGSGDEPGSTSDLRQCIHVIRPRLAGAFSSAYGTRAGVRHTVAAPFCLSVFTGAAKTHLILSTEGRIGGWASLGMVA
jgi:hypothetical protein